MALMDHTTIPLIETPKAPCKNVRSRAPGSSPRPPAASAIHTHRSQPDSPISTRTIGCACGSPVDRSTALSWAGVDEESCWCVMQDRQPSDDSTIRQRRQVHRQQSRYAVTQSSLHPSRCLRVEHLADAINHIDDRSTPRRPCAVSFDAHSPHGHGVTVRPERPTGVPAGMRLDLREPWPSRRADIATAGTALRLFRPT